MRATKRVFPALVALMFIVGAMASGAGAAVTTGAASFSLVTLPASGGTAKIGGDPVSFTIQVLDAAGNINLTSNGQPGDVLFSVTSSLAECIYPFGDTGAADPGGPGEGKFAAVSAVNIAPGTGLVLGHLAYGTTVGKDTVTVRMYEAVINNQSSTVAGAQIGDPKTFTITVQPGGAITAIGPIDLTDSLYTQGGCNGAARPTPPPR